MPGLPLSASLNGALRTELAAFQSLRRELTLFSGEFLGSFAGKYYYRFEIPESVVFRNLDHALFSLGHLEPVIFTGEVISLESQYLTVALPYSCGSLLPEIKCSWNYEENLSPPLDILSAPVNGSTPAMLLFEPDNAANTQKATAAPEVPASTIPEQLEALKQVLGIRMAVLWGPILSGKTHVLALAAAQYLKAGKRVLHVGGSNDTADRTFLRIIDICRQLGWDSSLGVRVGLPSAHFQDAWETYSFEHQLEAVRAEKRNAFQERVSLLDIYWRMKIKQGLNEDYAAKLKGFREKHTAIRNQLDLISKDLAGSKEVIERLEHLSMIDRFKKNTKDDLVSAQKQFTENQQAQKRLAAADQAISNDIMKFELNTPITFEDGKNFREAMKQIEELGGFDKVTKAVNEFTKVDGIPLLASKQLISTTVSRALSDPLINTTKFDVVIVSEAESVNIGHIAAVATLAKDSLVVSIDPFQLVQEPVSTNPEVRALLQKNILQHLTNTVEFHQLREWANQKVAWSIFLSPHFAKAPKVSAYISSVLFDDRMKVLASPSARGKIYFIDTTDLRSESRQYIGKKRILPCNDQQTKKVLECLKHALVQPDRHASDVGIVLPFGGTTVYTKLQLRMNGMKNVEVGTPEDFFGHGKKAIVFDTSVAGLNYTMRPIDDRKVGESRIARLFNVVLSGVGEDLYVIADMSHFKTLYKDRLITRLLMLLQAQGERQPVFNAAVKKFDELEWNQRAAIFSAVGKDPVAIAGSSSQGQQVKKVDYELELKMKMLAKQQVGAKPVTEERNFEREIYLAVWRNLGLRADVNLLSQYIGGDLLFNHSLTSEQHSARLPIDSCQSENDFRKAMEKWNLLIHELSGPILTYFAKSTPQSRVREDIKTLKVYYSSDMEAVVEEGKRRFAGEVGKLFQELLGKPQPTSPAEWSTAYLALLSRLESYLEWISEQLRK